MSGVLDRILDPPAIVQLALFAAHGAAVASHLALATVHLGEPRAAVLFPSLYGATTTLAFWSLALADAPYRRTDLLDPTSLLTLGTTLAR